MIETEGYPYLFSEMDTGQTGYEKHARTSHLAGAFFIITKH